MCWSNVCAFAAIAEEPYSLYSSHISEQNTVCAWYTSSIEKQLKLWLSITPQNEKERALSHDENSLYLKWNYRRAVREKNRADLPDHLDKVLLFFYKNNMENWTCLNFVTLISSIMRFFDVPVLFLSPFTAYL